jgi:hypothetical protein
MRKPTYVEAFPEFQALGRGVPFLAMIARRRTATGTKDRSGTTQSSKSTAKR